MKCAKVDLEDMQGGSKTGIHAACAAGAWYSIVRGMAGIEMFEDYVSVNPKMLPWWECVKFNLKWHGIKFSVKIDNDGFEICPKGEIEIRYADRIKQISSKARFEFLEVV